MLGLFCCLALSCSNTKPPLKPHNSWQDIGLCGEQLPEIIDSLAGPAAVDCGTTTRRWRMKDITNRSAAQCAQHFTKTDNTVVFGHTFFGADSGECEVILHYPDKPMLHLTYEYSVKLRDEPSRDAVERSLYVERCGTVIFQKNATSRGSYFRVEDCVKAQDETDRVLRMHNADS